MPDRIAHSPELLQAFHEYDRKVILNNVKIGCLLGVLLMPAGVVLDFFVYNDDPKIISFFLGLRLLCSVLIGLFWAVVVTPFGHKHPRGLGLLLAMFPSFFISWMIYAQGGSDSPYYAGLNLVLLVIGFVLHWTLAESLLAVALVVLMYVGACLMHGAIEVKSFANNLYFLVLTGIIVVTGSYVHSLWRFREFSLRYELDANKQKLEETNQKLLELDQAKSRFFANISHELRTPLTLLLAPLENLIQKFNRSMDGETRELLVTMHSNGMRLLKLINDLLDLVRLESGRIDIKREPLQMEEFIKGLASAVKQVAEDKRIRFDTYVDPQLGTVLADKDKLEKIELNLLFNALKFTPSGGRVSLRAEKQEEEIVLIVSDTGMGISRKNLAHVFDRFWQADGSSKRKYQGVGIGLALVKELAEAHGGSASVQSAEGKGTTFTVKLPYQPADKLEAVMSASGDTQFLISGSGSTVSNQEWLANLYRRAEMFPSMTPLKETVRPADVASNGNLPSLLVADDEPDMLRFLKSQLNRHYRVIEAVDGQQAVDKAVQYIPDIILLDMMMPEKDGLQACREIRQRTSTQAVPIVLLTARADEETKLAALEAGASDFLAKPFSTTELHVRIKNLVESHDYQIKLSKQNQVLESTIEQLKETETALVQSEKLASLGRMSAGIIHEINNPLNFATTGLFALRSKGKSLDSNQQAEFSEILNDVEEGVKRVKNIVSDLRMFTHPGGEQQEEVRLIEVVNASTRFLSGELKGVLDLEQSVPEDLSVRANKNKLIHVLVNLLQNSLDAVKRKEFPDGEKPCIWISAHARKGMTCLAVRDNGPGIEQEHLDKIFDPFFTTKDVGEGMGLGLSICYRIIQEFEGRISVKTETGEYCEFALEFPVRVSTAASA